MSLRLKKEIKSMKCKNENMSIKCKKTSKKLKFTKMKYIRMQHIMIRFNTINKQTKFKRLCKRLKYMRKNKMIMRKKMKYESFDKKTLNDD